MTHSRGDEPQDDPAAEDVGLMRRIAEARDRAAFVALYERYAGRIKGLQIKGGARPEDAEEAAQEVMIAVWRRADRYDPAKASVATWIYAIARNRRIDQIRRASRPEPDPEDPMFRPDPAPDPSASVVVADRDARLREAIFALNADQQEIVRLTFYLGLSQTEIAARLDAPLGTVKSRLRLAFGKLRGVMETDFDEGIFDD